MVLTVLIIDYYYGKKWQNIRGGVKGLKKIKLSLLYIAWPIRVKITCVDDKGLICVKGK